MSGEKEKTKAEFLASTLFEALTGGRGEDQKRIAEEVVTWGTLLLRKNNDYGSCAWKPPILAPGLSADLAMRIRMSDKIERINSLIQMRAQPEVNESLEDTIKDLGAYCLLWLARPKN